MLGEKRGHQKIFSEPLSRACLFDSSENSHLMYFIKLVFHSNLKLSKFFTRKQFRDLSEYVNT